MRVADGGEPGELIAASLTRDQLVIFTRQLATLLQAGVVLLKALDCLAQGAENAASRQLVTRLGRRISEGNKLSLAMAEHPQVFSPVYLALIQIGEGTGALVLIIECLADWLERDLTLLQKTKAALVYPCFLLATTGLMVFLLFGLLLPQLLDFLRGHGELPALTRALIAVTTMARNPVVVLGVLGGIAIGLVWLREQSRRPAGRRRLALALQSLPLVGALVRDAGLLRFCVAMKTMLRSGAQLLTTLEMAGSAPGNPLFAEAVGQVVERVRLGDDLGRALSRQPEVFPSILHQLIAVGLEAGRLERMLQVLVLHFQESLEIRMRLLEATLGPLVLSLAAGLVTIVMMAVFLPIYSSLDGLGR